MSLARDIAAIHLDAVPLAGGAWAYYDAASAAWWAVSTESLEVLGSMLAAHTHDAYERWCCAAIAQEIACPLH